MDKLEDLVNRTRDLAREWGALHDEDDGFVEGGAAAVVLLALTGALLSGPHATEALRRLSSACASVAVQNLAELERKPS